MELIAVPTGVNHRVAAYAYRGGSVFDRRDFYIGAALIKHPQGDLLVDACFGRDNTSRPSPDTSDLLKMVSVMQRIPEMIVVPSHDQRGYAEMARLPNVTTKGPLL